MWLSNTSSELGWHTLIVFLHISQYTWIDCRAFDSRRRFTYPRNNWSVVEGIKYRKELSGASKEKGADRADLEEEKKK